MKICIVVGSLLDFGGLEEFATNLAVGLKRRGIEVSVLSTLWVQPDNQYLRLLRANDVQVVQLPKWLSMVMTDWPTKQKILADLMWVSQPLVWLLGLIRLLMGKKSWTEAQDSARNWMQTQWLKAIQPDRRKFFVRRLLGWWRRKWKYDLIHIQGYTSALLFVIDWAAANKVPVIYEEHQTPDAQFDWWKDFKHSINKASLVVAVSEKSAVGLKEVAGVTCPIAVAYYVVPDPVESGTMLTPGIGKNDETVRITTPARLYVTKGLNYLLDAIVKVKADHPNAQFRVYGDGPLREELLEYAAKLGLDGEQIFVGSYTSRDHLARIMAETDIFALSSILEGLPLALLEAMSFGRAIVVTPVGGIPEAIQDGVNGLLCEPRDPECLARKLSLLIEHPELRRQYGEAARQTYIQGPFTPQAVCANFISIYQGVLSREGERS